MMRFQATAGTDLEGAHEKLVENGDPLIHQSTVGQAHQRAAEGRRQLNSSPRVV
jgi:hypothetical protein